MEPLELSEPVRERMRAAERVVVFSGAGVSRESGLDTFRGAGGLWERMRPEELATPGGVPGRSGEGLALVRLALPAGRRRPRPTPPTQRSRGWRPSSPSVLGGDPERRRPPPAGRQPESPGAARHDHAAPFASAAAAAGTWARRSPSPPSGRPSAPAAAGSAPPWSGSARRSPQEVLVRAYEEATFCDLFISVGTSATVYPAAGLIELAHQAGACLIEVNPEPTPFSASWTCASPRRRGRRCPPWWTRSRGADGH